MRRPSASVRRDSGRGRRRYGGVLEDPEQFFFRTIVVVFHVFRVFSIVFHLLLKWKWATTFTFCVF